MGEHLKKHFKAQGREPAHYVETAGKIFNIAFEEVFLEVNPADEMRILQKKMALILLLLLHLKDRCPAVITGSVAENVLDILKHQYSW